MKATPGSPVDPHHDVYFDKQKVRFLQRSSFFDFSLAHSVLWTLQPCVSKRLRRIYTNLSYLRYVEGFMHSPGDFYKNRILTKIGFKPTLTQSKAIQNHVKLSFLSAALDPQEMARRYWSYEGFMPIFWFGLTI